MSPRRKKKPSHGGKRRGAGRPSVMDTCVRLTVRVSADDADWLRELAAEHGVSVSEYLRQRIADSRERSGKS